jgi:dTDP-4-amino-4,6-dideoxygalactose transaminase
MYDQGFRDEELLTLPAPVEKNIRHAMHLYAILINLERLKVNRNEFVDRLIKENIGSGVHFAPIHLQPYYRDTYGYKKGDFPNAEFIGDRILSLPLGANLTDKDVLDVIDAVKYVLSRVKK